MYNYVKPCYCRVLSNELDSQIHWSSVPRRETFISVEENLQGTIYEILNNGGNFNKNLSMRAVAKFCVHEQASTRLRPNFVSTRKF